MTYEVVVVGGGIGGLTVTALLAARGFSVCLLERNSELGGCTASLQKFGYTFEPTFGLYGGWSAGGIHERVFAELSVAPPRTSILDPAYLVRLPDHSDVLLSADLRRFENDLRTAFPECAAEALNFYHSVAVVSDAVSEAVKRVPDLYSAGRFKKLSAFSSNVIEGLRIAKLARQPTSKFLLNTSPRFRIFIETQLQTLAGSSTDECPYLYACVLLNAARGSLFSISGGVSTLIDRLVHAINTSGGKVRLNSPVLRLAYSSAGETVGVVLLSGETVQATKAVISNLTVWDTYGKLVGMSKTPTSLRKEISSLSSKGAYLIYAGIDESAARSLPANHLLTSIESESQGRNDSAGQLTVAISEMTGDNAPLGKLPVVIYSATDVNDWFAYHEDESQLEDEDQSMLEDCWQKMHRSFPELGEAIDVIDTATPRSFYEETRRKLGMVGTPSQLYEVKDSLLFSHRTSLPKLFRVGDTTFPGTGIAAVTQSALIVANLISSE